jgi:RNase P subunit RPR2
MFKLGNRSNNIIVQTEKCSNKKNIQMGKPFKPHNCSNCKTVQIGKHSNIIIVQTENCSNKKNAQVGKPFK